MNTDYAALVREAEAAVVPPNGTVQELNAAEPNHQGVRLEDFWAYMPMTRCQRGTDRMHATAPVADGLGTLLLEKAVRPLLKATA